MSDFSAKIIDWQKLHGRHDLPWQTKLNQAPDTYAIWVSEIMLQQTQVAAVIGYYAKFMQRFPNINVLSQATQEEVLQHWSGLGYYSRARNLHSAAQKIMDEFGGIFPSDFEDVLSLPGIGRSTAAAISTFAFNKPQPILDGNVKRVFARHFLVEGWPSNPKIEKKLWEIALQENPKNDAIAYTQGLMDLGATLCTRSKPNCGICPVSTSCKALKLDSVKKIPTPKPRKILPEKSTVMLVKINGNEVMLEKRPQAGIWGGLWSFPEIDFAPNGVKNLPKITHTFTHFKLHIQPVLMQAAKQTHATNTLWIMLDEAIGAAIPTPVRKILLALQQTKFG
jgi:A/G-specific adenine glycosylase